MRELTEKQKAILEFLEQNKKQVYPTVKEIAAKFGVADSTAHFHLRALRRKQKLAAKA